MLLRQAIYDETGRDRDVTKVRAVVFPTAITIDYGHALTFPRCKHITSHNS